MKAIGALPFAGLGVFYRILLKWVVQKYDVRMWTGFWLLTGSSGGDV
jgi:hypothetical protein